MMPRRLVASLALALFVLLAAGGPDALVAQNADLGAQRLGRPYWHVFAAYAIGWAFILGWIVSIARRLRSVERKLDRE